MQFHGESMDLGISKATKVVVDYVQSRKDQPERDRHCELHTTKELNDKNEDRSSRPKISYASKGLRIASSSFKSTQQLRKADRRESA